MTLKLRAGSLGKCWKESKEKEMPIDLQAYFNTPIRIIPINDEYDLWECPPEWYEPHYKDGRPVLNDPNCPLSLVLEVMLNLPPRENVRRKRSYEHDH